MKKNIFIPVAALGLVLCACNKDETVVEKDLTLSFLDVSECTSGTKSVEEFDMSASIVNKKESGVITVSLSHVEYCCETDAYSVNFTNTGSKIICELIDKGPHSYCYCERDILVEIEGIEDDINEIEFIESDHSYSRDTVTIQIN